MSDVIFAAAAIKSGEFSDVPGMLSVRCLSKKMERLSSMRRQEIPAFEQMGVTSSASARPCKSATMFHLAVVPDGIQVLKHEEAETYERSD